MKLLFRTPHKSILTLPVIELPSFTVLTGINGSGKSHLLEAIENNSISIEGVPPNDAKGIRPIRMFDWKSLVPQDTGAFSSAQHSGEQASLWIDLASKRSTFLTPLHRQLHASGVFGLERYSTSQLRLLTAEDLRALGHDTNLSESTINSIKGALAKIESKVTEAFIGSDRPTRSRLVSKLSETTGVSILDLGQDEFYQALPIAWQSVDMFQQSFARIFSAYQRRWTMNELKEHAKSKGESTRPLSNTEFLAKFGSPPWEFVNELLATAGLDFRINQPYKWDDRPYEPILTDKVTGAEVRFNDLSSGERILMSFAFCIYHATDPNSHADFPRVLLFDEIDAPLHPSMTRSLLRTIESILVERHKVEVLLTSHSPSTVALAPELSVHVMAKTGPTRISKTTRDDALRVLTTGVPTLSINFENRRQIFTESSYDADYLGRVYEVCRPFLASEITLNFIGSGPRGNGNCDQVKSVVSQLSIAGNRTVLGVIDWDRKNSEAERIFVIGHGERYSIENFVLDPFLVGALLLRERVLTGADLGLDADFSYPGLPLAGQSVAQSLVNLVCTRMNSNPADNSVSKCRYENGFIVDAPNWYLDMQGHQLEELLKGTFGGLRRFHKEPELKLAIIDLILVDFPKFVPSTLVDLLRRLQAYPV
jgi:hypothetical protein